jgi:3-phenylpropionate/trans-cinnamate dioxygenase ferredoxin reductase subunit
MNHASKLVIVGGGYVGLECAATAIKQGLDVVVLEAEDRLLARVAGPELAGFFANVHRENGVDIRFGELASAFTGEKDVCGVTLASGETISADMVLVGIGVVPNQELAAAIGIECANGVVVDEFCQTSSADIYAVGDVCQHPSELYGKNIRLESVHNAIEQGKTAAAAIAGKPKPYNQVPWFWSDQYDLKLQIAGLSTGFDQTIVRGNPDDRSFAVFYLKEGRLIACDAVNSPAEYMGSRMLIGRTASPNPDLLADSAIPMKEIMAQI